jgi:hypothetical protein
VKSEDREEIQQDLQKDCRAGEGKVNSMVFSWATESE